MMMIYNDNCDDNIDHDNEDDIAATNPICKETIIIRINRIINNNDKNSNSENMTDVQHTENVAYIDNDR